MFENFGDRLSSTLRQYQRQAEPTDPAESLLKTHYKSKAVRMALLRS